MQGSSEAGGDHIAAAGARENTPCARLPKGHNELDENRSSTTCHGKTKKTGGQCDNAYPIAGKMYADYNGTSFAAPQVTGTIALLLSIDKSLAPRKAVDYILATADAINTDKLLGGDPSDSKGRALNVWKAALTASNGKIMNPTDPINNSLWYGVEVLNTVSEIQDVYLGKKIEKIDPVHKNIGTAKKIMVRFNARGLHIKQANSTVQGFDKQVKIIMEKDDIKFVELDNLDDYVFKVTCGSFVIGKEYSPVFIAPKDSLLAIDTKKEQCAKAEFVAYDKDAVQVEIKMAKNSVSGWILKTTGPFRASFSWCPDIKGGQTSGTFVISADDFCNPVVKKDIIAVAK